jgi:flavin reductase (DIM6/NTAB) family NADH-FMN oxidoreductase RutF
MKCTLLVVLMITTLFSNGLAQEKSAKENAIYMQKSTSKHLDPPYPVVLVGTKRGDQVNFMTSTWCVRLEADPYLLGISIQKRHFTHQAIMENKCFSINIPTVDMIPRVDAVGMRSGKEYDKSQIFKVFYGDNEKSPMVDSCIVSLECEVVDSVSLVKMDEAHPRSHTLFIAEVKNVWANKNGVNDRSIDFQTLKPILWTLSPNSFWTIGENKGPAFNPEHSKLVPKKQ